MPLASISPSLGHPHQSVKLKKVYSTCCVDLQHLTHHLTGFSACEIQVFQPGVKREISKNVVFNEERLTTSQVVRQISDIKSMRNWCILYIIYFISNVSYVLYLFSCTAMLHTPHNDQTKRTLFLPLSQPFFPQEHCHDAEITSCVTGNL